MNEPPKVDEKQSQALYDAMTDAELDHSLMARILARLKWLEAKHARYTDESPATEELCRKVVGRENTGRGYNMGEWVPGILSPFGYYGRQWIALPNYCTIGQLRKLCDALGVEVKEGE
jgi:hypothetical protein